MIVLVPMILNGRAGAKYGIPFPVLARASFGVKGANIPAVLRAIVACGWFGIQTWIGGLLCTRCYVCGCLHYKPYLKFFLNHLVCRPVQLFAFLFFGCPICMWFI